MNYYTVKEIAEMLGLNEETVRRWIRKGSLKAEQGDNRRHGSKVEENVLREFILNNKGLINPTAATALGIGYKDAAVIGGAVVASGVGGLLLPGVIPIAGALMGGMAWLKKIKESANNKKEVIEELHERKLELESIIMTLEYEISSKQSELKLAEESLKQLKELLNSDLIKIKGGEINEL